MANKLPQSDHFTYHELAEGMWSAIVKLTGLAASNSGIIDLGDRTLIFDTTFSPASALELRTVAESLTGQPVSVVLNSHCHTDHVFGNAVFDASTEIHATERTREIMAEKTEKEIVEFKNHWPDQQKKWAEHAKNAQEEAERLDYEDGVRFAQSIIDTFPQLQLRLPNRTFTDRVEFIGTKRTAEFVTFGGGHTDSDAILYLPIEKIIFTGDLLVIKNHPDLTHGDPYSWLNILAKIKALNPAHLVPGHGELGTLDDVINLENYINELLQMAKKDQPEDISALNLPSFTEDWNNSDAFEMNIKYLREKLLG